MPVVSEITQGHTLASIRAGHATVHEVTYAPGAFMPVHTHARANVTLVIGGSVDDEADGDLFRAAALSLVFKPSSVEHRTTCGTRGLRTIVIELDHQAEEAMRCGLGLFRRCTWFTGGEAVIATVRLWTGLLSGRQRPSDLLNEWLAGLGTARLRPESPLGGLPPEAAAAMALLGSTRGTIGTAGLARALGVHPSTVTRLFRRTFGRGVMACTRRERVRHAADQLATTGEPIARIATMTGFADQSHLTREFNRETGLPPARFRAIFHSSRQDLPPLVSFKTSPPARA